MALCSLFSRSRPAPVAPHYGNATLLDCTEQRGKGLFEETVNGGPAGEAAASQPQQVDRPGARANLEVLAVEQLVAGVIPEQGVLVCCPCTGQAHLCRYW